jgi:hypothetical protein
MIGVRVQYGRHRDHRRRDRLLVIVALVLM